MRDDNGVSVVTGAILVVAVGFIIFSIFIGFWVPRQGYEREREHMEEVRRGFSKLKSAIETIELLGSRSIDLKMAADPPPIFGWPAMGGTLWFDNSSGTLSFQANNVHYADQTWVYENGAVILVQQGKSVMASMPAMVAAIDDNGENIRIEVRTVRLKGKGFSIGGTGARNIVLVKENVIIENHHISSLTIAINSAYPDAWREYLSHLESTLNAKGYDAEVSDLSIIIRGKVYDSDVNDIYYLRKIIEVGVSVG